ncbi:hypothetical protein PENFLA_c041G05368 [Penicillium flavigenum]|uniref:F-box domain-containing protein n=1 Tax=Penicillium flavigenum TaxID=254877 RepID=A0A1V6SJ44_9EURO|nr:hypothetical protein PENFLA_c041G05368 [Penicillium flavigenum]
MALSELPTELVRDIAELLDTEKDVLLFAQLSRRFFDILIDYLYARNAKRSNASAMLWAAKHGYELTARQALANGANPSVTNLKLLDQPGINPDMSERSRIRPPRLFGQTPSSHAAMNGHVNVLMALLATNRVNIESKDMRGWTPLA